MVDRTGSIPRPRPGMMPGDLRRWRTDEATGPVLTGQYAGGDAR